MAMSTLFAFFRFYRLSGDRLRGTNLESRQTLSRRFLSISPVLLVFFWNSPVSVGYEDEFDHKRVPDHTIPNSIQDDWAPTPGLSSDEIFDGWLSLFDGETLFGWKMASQANWHVANGEIRADQGERGLLRTTSQFDDYELVLDFKGSLTTNSGVFLRTSPQPKKVVADCYELNICSPANHEFSTGALVGRATTELKCDESAWHQFRILADGDRIKVWIDGEKSVDYTDPKPLGRGFIGLQFNSGAVAFRKIRIKPLNQTPIKLTTDLVDWKTDQTLDSQFSATENGELQIKGGKGQLETKQLYGDFAFSMQCKTNAVGLNSGVFFRCIPGDLMNGYESQIQNEFKNGDRSVPVDCGTGGIFRRINARRVNANDNEWFAKTIIATGPHISIWINGYQVTDWADKRKPDRNPRRGLRLEKGTITLQGHDPTTDILMKNFRVRELSARGK